MNGGKWLGLALAVAAAAASAAPDGSALSALNAAAAEMARTHPEFRADIEVERVAFDALERPQGMPSASGATRSTLDPGASGATRRTPVEAAPGRQAARGPVLGPFTYRPKTYAELSPAERIELLHSPEFRRLVVERGRQAAAPVRFALTPEEMLSPRPFRVELPAVTPAPDVDPETLARLIATAQAQVATALWLSAGMVCAEAGIVFLALGWRRMALLCGLAYSATLCFIPNGHALILGPIGCAAAALGFAWPRRRPAP